ncbi:fibro-slime domain-containing protein [Nannocystis radixulma]|uniref:Fibro-slime domain-containing protein n=1 Tax=Nannocystis radixulma TaxID=2995305 RepID=A0ABT5BK00_9BACT|nr:fibro-slime domain-containing protein [Nannocystis radixulma]MDC0673342.1 fibro-slime domain-containing protein [Nannocystis radixulma]
MTLTVACGDNGAVQGTESDSGASTGNTPGTTDGTSNPTDGGTATDSSATEGTDSGTASDSTPTTTDSPVTDTSATDTSDTTTDSTTQPVTSSTTDETTTTTTGDETTTSTDTSTSDTTTGDTTTDDSTTTTTTGEPPLECGTLQVTFRDLKPLHPDFGCHMWGNMARPGLVQNMLGGDGKPVFNAQPPPAPGYQGSNPQITSAASFSDWYNSKADVSMEIEGGLELMEIQPGIWSFESDEFFPLTGFGFGNNVTANWAGETYPDRNGSFTTEIHTNFVYEPGQTFSFSGDDDVWIFIDGKLAMDLGGLHPPANGTIELDTLGLVPNQTYTLDAFHAERCEAGSNFRIDTSISCFVPM